MLGCMLDLLLGLLLSLDLPDAGAFRQLPPPLELPPPLGMAPPLEMAPPLGMAPLPLGMGLFNIVGYEACCNPPPYN